MQYMQATKAAIMVAPQTIGTTAVTGYVDTLGYDHVRVYYQGATAAASDVITALKLQQGEATNSFTDISGAVGGTDFTIPAPNTSTPDVVIFDVDTRNKKRYLNISITGDATTRTTSVMAVLDRAAQMPDTDTEAGAAEIVYV